ncbi:MAG: PilZ domain-containing protein [bacterium]
MKPEEGDKRRHKRRVFTTTVQYAVTQPAVSDTLSKGVTVNISSTGLCLYTFSSHKEGQQVKIYNGVPLHIEEEAVIRWVKKLNRHLYKIGCEFSL